jgi:hypothetical protein
MIEYEDLRITKLRKYLFSVVNQIVDDKKYQINADMLSNDINNYSLDKMPVEKEVESWIIDVEKHRDVFSFRGRFPYSQKVINNLKNVGFFEIFESIIKSNNEKGNLPDIGNIESIRTLNPGTMNSTDGVTAEFDIQIEITYLENNVKED